MKYINKININNENLLYIVNIYLYMYHLTYITYIRYYSKC